MLVLMVCTILWQTIQDLNQKKKENVMAKKSPVQYNNMKDGFIVLPDHLTDNTALEIN